jgi:hypothetical protein
MTFGGVPLVFDRVAMEIDLLAQQVGDSVPRFLLSEAFSAEPIRNPGFGSGLPLRSVSIPLHAEEGAALVLSAEGAVGHFE